MYPVEFTNLAPETLEDAYLVLKAIAMVTLDTMKEHPGQEVWCVWENPNLELEP